MRFQVKDLITRPRAIPGTVAWQHFRVFDFTERIGWYFIVVDKTTDFLVNWASMAYQFSGCTVADAPYAIVSGSVPYIFFSIGSWHQVVLPVIVGQNIWSAFPGVIGANTEGPKHVAGGVLMSEGFRNPKATLLEMRIEATSFSGTKNYVMPIPDHDNLEDQSWDLTNVSFNTLNPPTTYKLFLRATFGWVTVQGGVLSAQGTLDKGLLPDP